MFNKLLAKFKMLFFIFILITFSNVFIISEDSPDMTMKNLINLFKSYNRNFENLTADQVKQNSEISNRIEDIFDFHALIKGALIDQWDDMSQKQRDDFYDMFKELIEMIAYPQGSYFYNNSKNNFNKAVLEGNKAVIKSNNYNYDKDLEISITYIFQKTDGKWKMVDIAMRDRSLIEEYRFRINRIVNKQGLDGLMDTLRVKYNEIKNK